MSTGQIDESIIAYALTKEHGLQELLRAGVSVDDFVEDYRLVWKYICKMHKQHSTVPSKDVLLSRYPDIHLPKVKAKDLPILLYNLRQRRKFTGFLDLLHDGAVQAVEHGFDTIDEVIQQVQGSINNLSRRNQQSSTLVDLFNPDTSVRMVQDIKARRDAPPGIPTGLPRFDELTGGLHPTRMFTIIGRPGMGKSWLDLLFVAMAVKAGKCVVLYPLEMSLSETALRLYTLFTQLMWSKNLSNMDLMQGRVTTARLQRFLNKLEDRFAGKLYVADIATLSDPYTVERIEAEVAMLKPDMFWVDYLTLLKAPGGRGKDDWGAVGELSTGIKNIAMRHAVVGGCSAQVNRAALKDGVKANALPRLEHIAYGDSIGQDADQVLSINRKDNTLFYALVKNRLGPEFGPTRVKFFPDTGRIEEVKQQEGEEDA